MLLRYGKVTPFLPGMHVDYRQSSAARCNCSTANARDLRQPVVVLRYSTVNLSLPGTHVAYRKRSAARCQDLAAACGYVASAGLRRSCGTSLDCKTKIVVTRSTTGCVEISGQVALLSPKNAGVNSNNVLYRVSYMRHVTVHKLPIGVLHE